MSRQALTQVGHPDDMPKHVFEVLIGQKGRKYFTDIGEDSCTWATRTDPYSEIGRTFIAGYTHFVETALFQSLREDGMLKTKREFQGE